MLKVSRVYGTPAKATFSERWCFTERREPRKIGPRAIRNRLKYVTAIPSGVAASRPVRFDALETLSTMVKFWPSTSSSAMVCLDKFNIVFPSLS